jgi:hypothetical protein
MQRNEFIEPETLDLIEKLSHNTGESNHFREVDRQHKQFTIDISGTDFHFILDEKDKL